MHIPLIIIFELLYYDFLKISISQDFHHHTHYSLVREINNILHYGGHATRKEEKNIFVDTIPNHVLSDDDENPEIFNLIYINFYT